MFLYTEVNVICDSLSMNIASWCFPIRSTEGCYPEFEKKNISEKKSTVLKEKERNYYITRNPV